MSINRLVSIERALNEAIGDMGMNDQRVRPLFMRWAEAAERKIGSFYSLKRKYFNLTIGSDCHRANLPCGVEAIFGIIYGDTSACNCDAIFRNSYNYYGATGGISYGYGLAAGGYFNTPGVRQWEIQDDQIVFLYPMTAGESITIDAAYRQMDSNDRFLMVPEEHINAIGAYIMHMRAKGSRWLPSEFRMDLGDVDRLNRDWGRERRNARALSSAPSPAEWAETVTMFNNPLSGYHGYVCRYPDEFRSLYNIG